MALGSAQAPLAAVAATSGESVRRRAGDAVRGRSSANGDAASYMGSLYEFRNGRGEIEMNGSGSVKQSPPPLLQQSGTPKLLTLPTVLTIGRVAAVPLLMRLGTAFGAFLDPVADKLMVSATLVLLCTKPLKCAVFGDVPWLLAAPSITIIGREITMSSVREWAASQNGRALEAVAVNSFGKWKTATQMTALTVLLASRDPRLAALTVLVAAGVVLLYISAGLAPRGLSTGSYHRVTVCFCRLRCPLPVACLPRDAMDRKNTSPQGETARVLVEFLEVAITSIVFLKGFYPSEAFERRRYMNVVVHRARHPQLSGYIHSVTAGLLPFVQKTRFLLLHCALVMQPRIEGLVERVNVIFYDNEHVPVEKFVFKIIVNQSYNSKVEENDVEFALRAFLIKLTVAEPLTKPLPSGSGWEVTAYFRALPQDSSNKEAQMWVPTDTKQWLQPPDITPIKSMSSEPLKVQLYLEHPNSSEPKNLGV
ncbi:HORMA domain [Musa troglodytarum]|uniref:HORMA domain n=1 Tax=Musa troglodytarum TaxID=320322 RepID=A0A9E7L9K4_9LILI|nr:HORMA domain [Musa troglodytarum]